MLALFLVAIKRMKGECGHNNLPLCGRGAITGADGCAMADAYVMTIAGGTASAVLGISRSANCPVILYFFRTRVGFGQVTEATPRHTLRGPSHRHCYC